MILGKLWGKKTCCLVKQIRLWLGLKQFSLKEIYTVASLLKPFCVVLSLFDMNHESGIKAGHTCRLSIDCKFLVNSCRHVSQMYSHGIYHTFIIQNDTH